MRGCASSERAVRRPEASPFDAGRHRVILAAALTVVPGPAGSITFVVQKAGPFAGRWMLPGGGIEVGERARDAAVSETWEETGIEPSGLDLAGVYETRGAWPDGTPFHVLMSAFLARGTHRVDAGFRGDNGGGVCQVVPDVRTVSSSDLRILADVGVMAVDEDVVAHRLRQDGLQVCRVGTP